METLQFKTTIKCSGCIANATPFLNEALGENNWKVDVQNPDKVLTVTNNEALSANDIIKSVEKAGYKAEVLN